MCDRMAMTFQLIHWVILKAIDTPPSQAVKQIEVIRGAGALQYGSQFGGLVNFRMKEGQPDQDFQFRSENSLGSFDFFNTFNSFSGSHGDLNYYSYLQYKRGNGFRDNSSFEAIWCFCQFELSTQ